MFSPKLYFLEMELLRLEQEYAAAADAARRRSVAEQIMMNLDTLRELEAAGKRSKKIDASDWMRKYAVTALPAGTERAAEVAAAPASAAPAPVATVHADNLEQQVEAISGEPFDPQRYAEKKGRIEALMALLVKARESSTAAGLTELLTRLWEVAVREDDAYDTHQRTLRR
ncbi:MAG: hypothetical protein JSR82_01970 [Verrucomicrobia bacterium]|nr:hypothetical protein [Verrucomicrobiota bacterium]